jgi:hypothetical protein
MNRRKFLRDSGAAVAAGVIVPMAFGLDSPTAPPIQDTNAPRVTAVIFDERYHCCRIFATALNAHGAKPFATSGNSAALWYGPLRAHLIAAPGRVAGLTTESDRCVSLACGRELRLKPFYQGAHDARPGPSIAHRAQCGTGRDEIAAAIRDSHVSWPVSLAGSLFCLRTRVALRIDPSSAPIALARTRPLATTPLSPGFPGYLVSWLLAPSELV